MSLDHILQSYRSKLLIQESYAEAAIRIAHKHALGTIQPHVEHLLKQYKDARSGDDPVPLHWLYVGNKVATIKHAVSLNVNTFGAKAKDQVLSTQHTAVQLGTQSAHAQLGTFAPGHTVQAPEQKAQAKIVGTTQQGKPISDLMDGFGDEAADRCGKALVAGVSMGQKPDTIDRAIMVALLISLNRALVIARTSEMEAYRSSVLLTFQVNDSIAKLWEWQAMPGACKFCQSMDGTRHDISENMASHPNCRCQMKLITIGV